MTPKYTFSFQGDSFLANIHMQQTFWLLAALIGSVIDFVLFNIAVSPKNIYILSNVMESPY
jgi:hypothetical protein